MSEEIPYKQIKCVVVGDGYAMILFDFCLTLKAPITTAADDSLENIFHCFFFSREKKT